MLLLLFSSQLHDYSLKIVRYVTLAFIRTFGGRHIFWMRKLTLKEFKLLIAESKWIHEDLNSDLSYLKALVSTNKLC